MQMTHKHDVYFSPHSTEAHNLVMQIADYCNKRGIWYKISESTLGIGIVYGGNVAYVIEADRKTEPQTDKKPCGKCEYHDWKWDEHIGYVDICKGIGRCPYNVQETITSEPQTERGSNDDTRSNNRITELA